MCRDPMFMIFYSNFGPYHIARLNALARILPNMLAVEIATSEIKYPWQRESDRVSFVASTLHAAPYETLSPRMKKMAVRNALTANRPEIVAVVGYSSSEMREVAMWAHRMNLPCIMTTDTTAVDKPRNPLKELLKGLWCRRYYNALFLSGERSAAYYVKLGFPEHLIWRGTDVIDNGFFEQSCRAVQLCAEEARERLGLPTRYFVSVCRLSPEKNVHGLLKAYAGFRQKGGNWDLVIVGSGPEEKNLKNMTAVERIPGVHFVGWKQYEDLPAYYALASCFVLASVSEPWGLAVNEAMACGLPVLASKNCGCIPELCLRGVNGYDFDPRDMDSLMSLMLQVAADEQNLSYMGRLSHQIIANFTPETWALSMRDCILASLSFRSEKKAPGVSR
jgi:1,2-diacylglycerol 3-alpha-glucosyltransferase